jgi:hypothetical protein
VVPPIRPASGKIVGERTKIVVGSTDGTVRVWTEEDSTRYFIKMTATNCGSTGHKFIDLYPSMKVFLWPVDPQFVAHPVLVTYLLRTAQSTHRPSNKVPERQRPWRTFEEEYKQDICNNTATRHHLLLTVPYHIIRFSRFFHRLLTAAAAPLFRREYSGDYFQLTHSLGSQKNRQSSIILEITQSIVYSFVGCHSLYTLVLTLQPVEREVRGRVSRL